jgi:pyruvate,water dikinase
MGDQIRSPFDVGTPQGAEGWERLYAYSSQFSEDRRPYEEGQFWFLDGIHVPKAVEPWEATVIEYALIALSQYNTRHYVIPPSLGVDIRILNGYVYLSPLSLRDASVIEARIPEFEQRAGYYFANWDRLYNSWIKKAEGLINDLESIDFRRLPEREEMSVLTDGRGSGSGYELLAGYERLLTLVLKTWNYHFEFLNLGYAAYLDFFAFCRSMFPGMPDQTIASMVAGLNVDLFRPDQELKRLAELAVRLGVDATLDEGEPDDVFAALTTSPEGEKWLAEWRRAQQPWFNFSSGSGLYHSDRVWLEHPDLPVQYIRGYIERLRAGETLDRPTEQIMAERDRVVAEYTGLMESANDRETFARKLRLARTVFPYVENHNFYIEHWAHSIIWRKMRQLGAVLVDAGFLREASDIFLLRRGEVSEALFDLYHGWAVGADSRGPAYWPQEVATRRRIMDALHTWSPPPALGSRPDVITEPFTIVLWGITSESVGRWSGRARDSREVRGFAASPGVAEGPARVVTSPAEIADLRVGEVLVAPMTAPSWAPVFTRIAATVTDVGGVMSHAAIVCREYGLPAVTGTAVASTVIKTGQRIRVDGGTGIVTLLDA